MGVQTTDTLAFEATWAIHWAIHRGVIATSLSTFGVNDSWAACVRARVVAFS
jgi:hypothetical protein